MVNTINEHRIAHLSCAANVPDFKAITLGERRWITGASWDIENHRLVGQSAPKHAYLISLWGLIADAVAKTQDGNIVNITLDRHQELQGRTKASYELTKARRILRPEFIKKLGTLSFYLGDLPKPEGIQAADLYAYLWGSSYRLGVNISREREDALMAILESKSPGNSRKIGEYDEETYEQILNSSAYRTEFKYAT